MDLPTDPALSFGLLLGAAFAFGMGAKALRLPAMVGFLISGVALHSAGIEPSPALGVVSDIGVTVLMFVIGLKLEPRVLLKPVVWGGGVLHAALVTALGAALVFAVAQLGLFAFAGLDPASCLLIGFGLAFSSTVFAAKMLESTAETATTHGLTSIGILIVQDLLAVAFLTASLGKIPSPYALLLLALIPLRPLFGKALEYAGHGDLLVATGAALALFFGAFLFSIVGLKADLGALIMGALLSSHPKAKELAESLMGFKEVLLIGFFLNIGLSETVTLPALASAAFLMLLLPVKAALFVAALRVFRQDAHTAFRTTTSLTTYSEFGLIVVSVAVGRGWLPSSWLVILAIALTLSFLLASPLNRMAPEIETQAERILGPWFPATEEKEATPYPEAEVLVFGLGRLGAAAFERLSKMEPSTLGIDSNPLNIEDLKSRGVNVVQGDVTDPLCWRRISNLTETRVVVLMLPEFTLNRAALAHLQDESFPGEIFAAAHYPDQVEKLQQLGAKAFYVHADIGAGIADRVEASVRDSDEKGRQRRFAVRV